LAEFDIAIIIGGISAVCVVLTLVFSVYFKKGDKKEKGVTDRRALEIEVERTAGAKGIIERATAKELKENAEKIAQEVKTETMRAVDQLFATLEAATELDNLEIASEKRIHDAAVDSEMKARDVRINQNRRDSDEAHVQIRRDFNRFLEETFYEFKKSINTSLDKQNEIIRLIQSTLYGPDAHSFPNYMYGKEQTQEESQKPDIGVFEKQSEESKQKQTSDNVERMKQDDDSSYY
jgi:hypothetical protein